MKELTFMNNKGLLPEGRAVLYKTQLEFLGELSFIPDDDCCEDLTMEGMKEAIEAQKSNM